MSEKAPSPFFKNSTLQFAWDSTSIGLLMECPRKYQLSIILGWRKIDQSVHLRFGGHFASSMEVYAKVRSLGGDHEDALDATVAAVLEMTWDRPKDDLADHDAMDNSTGSPWISEGKDASKKNRETLIRSVIWYFEEYKDDPAKTIILPSGKPATELSFRFDSGISDPFGGEYMLTGHMDRLVTFCDDLFVMDQKTTGGSLGSYYFSKFDLDNQMSQYTYAGRVVYNIPVKGVIIDAAAILVGSTTYGRSITMRSQGQLDEWIVNTEATLRLAERFADTGYYPMNLKSCDNYGGCDFKNVCNKDPSVREQYLKTDFAKRYWNPLEPR